MLQDLATELIRQLGSAGQWWAALAVALLVALVAIGARRGWFKVGPAEPVDPNLYGGDPNIVTGPPSEYGGGTPPEPGDGTGAGGG